MRNCTLSTRITQGTLIILFVFIVGGPSLQSNLSIVAANKYLIDDQQFTPDIIKFRQHESPPSSQKLTTVALLEIGKRGTDGQAQAEAWLQQAIGDASVEEQQAIGVRLERQAERWASRGQMEAALVAFGLVHSLAQPFPEPYFRMGQFRYATLIDIGTSKVEAFELATTATAATPRDKDFKSMAHTRLCEHYARSTIPNYQLAEYHCREALRIADSAKGSFMTGYGFLAGRLLEEILAKQDP